VNSAVFLVADMGDDANIVKALHVLLKTISNQKPLLFAGRYVYDELTLKKTDLFATAGSVFYQAESFITSRLFVCGQDGMHK
jgi:hypothetical protein